MDKNLMKNERGSPITENLFLEVSYSDKAIYTLKEEDYEYNGKLYPSIKALYLGECLGGEEGEYDFAIKNFISWKHWQRICRNKQLKRHIEEWREELEVKQRSMGLRRVIESADAGSYQAAKWVAEGGFCKRKAGRPSREDIQNETAKDQRLADEYGADITRLNAHL